MLLKPAEPTWAVASFLTGGGSVAGVCSQVFGYANPVITARNFGWGQMENSLLTMCAVPLGIICECHTLACGCFLHCFLLANSRHIAAIRRRSMAVSCCAEMLAGGCLQRRNSWASSRAPWRRVARTGRTATASASRSASSARVSRSRVTRIWAARPKDSSGDRVGRAVLHDDLLGLHRPRARLPLRCGAYTRVQACVRLRLPHETVDHHRHGDAFLASAQCTQASHVVCATLLFVTINSRLSTPRPLRSSSRPYTTHDLCLALTAAAAVPCGRGPDGA